MKKFSIYSLILTFFFALTACDGFLEGYEDSPNEPQDVPMSSLLTQGEVFTYFLYGDELARTSSIIMQQMTGADRQFVAQNRYVIGSGDFETTWEFNAYAGAFNNCRIIIKKAESANAPHYAGVARILMAMNLGIMTDCFGDIPYSQALKGNDNLTPVYDSQEEIYNAIFSLLDQGISDLAASSSSLSPRADDLIYGGDREKWTKLAYSLKARYLNHLSKKGDRNAEILAAISKGFTSAADDALGRFQSAVPQSNLWYQFTVVDREGYIAQSGFMYDLMERLNDPRIPFYRTEDLSGLPVLGQATSPLLLMTYMELKFIEAEVKARQNADAATPLREAIQASMNLMGVPADQAQAFINATVQNTLQSVMTHKYIAMYTQLESWTDWRRTGIPALTPVADGQINEIPRRFPYPQSEYLYNPNTPVLEFPRNLTDRVWWDR
jgi:hypothetical protein